MTLLVAVADATADRELVAAAQSLAAVAGWEIRAVHVREPGVPEPTGDELGGIDLTILDGEPVATLGALMAESPLDAVALGLKGGADEPPAIGPVAGALLLAQHAPALLVRSGMHPITALKRLYVPLEGSPSTSVAMAAADDAFCGRGREIVMLHVVSGNVPAEIGSLSAPRMMDQEHYEWRAWQKEFTMRFSQCPDGGRHRVAVRVGEPAVVIAEEASKTCAELIVLSWRGRTEVESAVVRKLLLTAPCPLFLVRREAPDG
jgi:nucleotide-binding universal stress UspA family protein